MASRKAFNAKNYAFASTKFREYLSKFGNAKESSSAKFGLALGLLKERRKKYDEARELLQGLAAVKDFTDRTQAMYYPGDANRGAGLQELAQAKANPRRPPSIAVLLWPGSATPFPSIRMPSRLSWRNWKSRRRENFND